MTNWNQNRFSLYVYVCVYACVQKYESYRFDGDPDEVGHKVTTRCTTRQDCADVRYARIEYRD